MDLYHANDGDYYLTLDECVLGDISDCEPLSEFGERIHKLPLGIDTEWGRQIIAGMPLTAEY